MSTVTRSKARTAAANMQQEGTENELVENGVAATAEQNKRSKGAMSQAVRKDVEVQGRARSLIDFDNEESDVESSTSVPLAVRDVVNNYHSELVARQKVMPSIAKLNDEGHDLSDDDVLAMAGFESPKSQTTEHAMTNKRQRSQVNEDDENECVNDVVRKYNNDRQRENRQADDRLMDKSPEVIESLLERGQQLLNENTEMREQCADLRAALQFRDGTLLLENNRIKERELQMRKEFDEL